MVSNQTAPDLDSAGASVPPEVGASNGAREDWRSKGARGGIGFNVVRRGRGTGRVGDGEVGVWREATRMGEEQVQVFFAVEATNRLLGLLAVPAIVRRRRPRRGRRSEPFP